MSHFTVMVIGENPEKQLTPFHEFECTGEDNEYIKDIDETEENLKNFNKNHKSGSTPKLVSANDSKYLYDTFEKYVIDYLKLSKRGSEDDKYGYYEKLPNGSIRTIRRTNPNAKWDWYKLGGRWTGYLKLKEIKSKNDRHYPKHEVGSPGLMTNNAKPGYCDQTIKKHIDIEGIRSEAGGKAKKSYEFVEKICNSEIPKIEKSWQEFIDDETLDWDERREQYNFQKALIKFNELKNKVRNSNDFTKEDKKQTIWLELPDYQVSKEEYISNAETSALSTFAIIKDSKWYEKGSMGWWNCVSDEKDQNNWNKEFSKLFDSLPEDELISIYDCHI